MKKSFLRAKTKVSALLMAGIMFSTVCISANVQAAGTSNGKEEVIYVNSDANGKILKTYAVNIFSDKEITDYGNYSEVKNMNTTDIISYNDGVVNIHNSADKLYYEGVLENAELPWNINITYKMDGKEYSAEEIAGKSGKLEIEISITKNIRAKEGFFDNYALQATVRLSTEKCLNIVGEGATTANVGNLKQLNYTIMPGKEKDILISSDVTDFEMESIAINGMRLNLDIDRNSVDTGELDGTVEDLQDAVKKLDDGTNELSGGAGKLKDGSQNLNDGIATINDALTTVSSKSSTLTSGSSSVKEALETIQSSLANVALSTDDLTKLGTASTQIKAGIDALTGGLQTMDDSIGNFQSALSSAGLTDISAFVDNHNKAISALGITNTQRAIYSVYQTGGESGVQSKLGELVTDGDAEAVALYTEYTGGDTAAITNYITAATKLISIEQLLQADIAYIQGSQQLINGIDTSLDNNTGALMTGATALQSNYNTFNDSIQSMVSKLSALATSMNTLKNGINTLVTNYNTLDNGIAEYTNAVNSITSGYGQITEGAMQLVNGVSELYNGTLQLTNGTGEFADETSGMKDEVNEKIDIMLDEFTKTDYEVVSFISDKNENVKLVQFVIKTTAIEKTEAEYVEDTEENETNLFKKFLKLFGINF